MEKICGIYKITSPSGKIYIGQSTDISRRFNEHKSEASRNRKNNNKLYNSIKKYGWKSFDKDIIELCSKENLSIKEKFYISYYDSFNNGLNSTSGGEESYIRDEKYKENMSKKRKGKYFGNQNIKFTIDNILYNSIGEASTKLNIPPKTIHNRLNSKNILYQNYLYVEKDKNIVRQVVKYGNPTGNIFINSVMYSTYKEASDDIGLSPMTIHRKYKKYLAQIAIGALMGPCEI